MTALEKIISELRTTANVPIELNFEKTSNENRAPHNLIGGGLGSISIKLKPHPIYSRPKFFIFEIILKITLIGA